MSGKKYKIYQNGQFLGHWCATSPKQAIEKMSKTTIHGSLRNPLNEIFR